MRLSLAFILFLSACPGQHGEFDKPVGIAPGSESTYGQCPGEYSLDLSQKQIDFGQFVDADYDNKMRGRIIVKSDGGQLVGCLLNRDQCGPPNMPFTYPSGRLTVCIEPQHCCNLQ